MPFVIVFKLNDYNTLETLSLFGGSLIIREYAPDSECNINKCITIRFDGQNQFIIQSYRADEVKASGETFANVEYVDKLIDQEPLMNLNKAVDMLKGEKHG